MDLLCDCVRVLKQLNTIYSSEGLGKSEEFNIYIYMHDSLNSGPGELE